MSSTQPPAEPIEFGPGIEHEEANKSAADADLETALKGIRENTYKNSGHARRTLHAKSHGVHQFITIRRYRSPMPVESIEPSSKSLPFEQRTKKDRTRRRMVESAANQSLFFKLS